MACLADIDGGGGDYTTLGAFTDPDTKESIPITRIGGAAYRLSTITGVNTLTIADSVTEIGPGAFYSSGFPKNCITFDLANTVTAEAYAFYGMGPVRLIGNELTTIGIYTLTSMSKMIVACLPKLDTMIGAQKQFDNKNKAAFVGCAQLRVAYVGPSRNVRYLQHDNNTNNVYTSVSSNNKILKMFFINGAGVEENVTMTSFSHMSVIVGNCDATFYRTVGDSANGVRISAGTNFENIVLSDWYTLTGENGGIEYSVTLPGYLYTKNDTANTLTLRAVTYDLEEVHGFGNLNELYVTPDALYVNESEPTVSVYSQDLKSLSLPRYEARELVGEPQYKVTSIGMTAYNGVVIKTKYLKIGSSTTTLGIYMCYTGSTVSNVQTLDLNNVKTVNQQALNAFGSAVKNVIANRVTSIGQYGFANLSSVKKLYLPAIETIGNYAFGSMSSLNELILGENFSSFANNPMHNVEVISLKIIILNGQKVIKSPVKQNDNNNKAFGNSKTKDNNGVFVVVPQKQYEAYQAAYGTTGWTSGTNTPIMRVPFENFSIFESDYFDETQNLTFFWSKINEEEKTAKITFVVGNQIPDTLVFPDVMIDEDGESWTVVSVEKSAIELLSAVGHIVLPAGMEYLGFDTVDLPAHVQSLSISDENTKFKTMNGVLYSKDGKVLFMVPRGNTPADSVFNMPDTVIYVADEAFYGVSNILTMNISSPVRFGYRVFAETQNLTEIYFTSGTPSEFVGRDIFLNADPNLVLYVPTDSVAAYRANVWLNYEIREMIQAIPAGSPEDTGEETPGDETVTE